MTYEDLRISRSIKGEGLILFTNSQKSRHGPECILKIWVVGFVVAIYSRNLRSLIRVHMATKRNIVFVLMSGQIASTLNYVFTVKNHWKCFTIWIIMMDVPSMTDIRQILAGKLKKIMIKKYAITFFWA